MPIEDIVKLFEGAVPLRAPVIKEPERSCNNCEDYIVCYGLEEAENPDTAKECKNWQLDLMTYQKLIAQEAQEATEPAKQ